MFDFDFSEYLKLPVNAAKSTVSAVKTAALTHEIHKELGAGKSIFDVLCEKLPMSDTDATAKAAEDLEKGVDDAYKSQEADGQSVTQILNHGMMNLTADQKIRYLRNIVAIVPADALSETAQAAAKKLDGGDKLSEDETNALIEAAEGVVDEHAGVLATASFRVMSDGLEKLPSEFVAQMANCSRDTARAQAAACYILSQCGEDPWLGGQNAGDMTPYDIGVSATAGVESSKLMYAKMSGQVTAEKLRVGIRNIINRAIALITSNWLRAVAFGIQVVTAFKLFDLIFSILWLVHFGPVLTAILSGFLAVAIVKHGLKNEELVDALKILGHAAKAAFDRVKAFVMRVFHIGEAAGTVEVQTQEAAETAEADENAEADETAETAETAEAAETTEAAESEKESAPVRPRRVIGESARASSNNSEDVFA